MRKYDMTSEPRLEQVFCNQCGRKLKVENGLLKEGCFSPGAVFGYFSKRDGKIHHFDLCEDCYDRMIEQFSIPVEETETIELL